MQRILIGIASTALLAQPTLAWAQSYAGTARLTVQRTVTLEGETKGPGRVAFEGLVETCNNIRTGIYMLPAQEVGNELLTRLDHQQVDHYFNTDRAATYITGVLLELPDLPRWSRESSGNPNPQSVAAPDCAKVAQHENRTATIWRDGMVWRLDFTTRRALGARRSADFMPRPMPLARPFASLPTELIAGAPCHEVVAPPIEFFDGQACLWAVFPAAKYLNFPWALRAETHFGMPKKIIQRDQARVVERNGVLDPGVFDIPAGFTRAGPAP